MWKRAYRRPRQPDPGAGRRQGLRPRWDVMHPDRLWATLLQPRLETAETVAQEASTSLTQRLS
ncbi:MAG: Eco29kI family restriction endonuclease [Propioniciclava sp.]